MPSVSVIHSVMFKRTDLVATRRGDEREEDGIKINRNSTARPAVESWLKREEGMHERREMAGTTRKRKTVLGGWTSRG